MKPPRFEYEAPTSLDKALVKLAEYGEDAAVLAGGQSLIPMMNLRNAAPRTLIDIMRIPGLEEIRRSDGCVEIGARVRQAEAERSVGVSLLVQALHHVGHVATRNAGTVCGSIAHADPAGEIPAVALALDAEIVLTATRGSRSLRAEDFFISSFATARATDELITAIRLPLRTDRAAFLEATPRLTTKGEFATAGVAVSLRQTDDGRFEDAAIALFGVGETAVRAREAERLLMGAEPTRDLFIEAAERAAANIDPVGDVHSGPEHRRRLIRVLTRRALEGASE
jgi:carbon-monoxide dehydrogenase medium subunit